MGKKTPLVSVIIGVYNPSDWGALERAVRSVLHQTLQDFELIIYDDGSTPEIHEKLLDLRKLSDRIRVFGQTDNHGLAFGLNRCLEAAGGKYIARMDDDDVSAPERLAIEAAFLDAHPEYSWCGTNAFLFDADGVYGERRMPEIPEKSDYLRYLPFIHPSVMYRRELFDELRYKEAEETWRCEDLELFMRLEKQGFHGANIQKNLFFYREDPKSFQKRRMKYRLNETAIRFRHYRELKMLFPIGWLCALRPVIGGLVPDFILSKIKRWEAQKYGDGNRTYPEIPE